MTAFDAYPPGYRAAEINTILAALKAGECVSVVGLSGAGKSNLLGFMATRVSAGVNLVLIDGNRARPKTADGLLSEMARALEALTPQGGAFERLESAVDARLSGAAGLPLCLLLDRFDALSECEQSEAAGPLRALRDEFKYRLAYLIAARSPIDSHSELSELFYAHTFWLGPLALSDADWSARQYAARRSLDWDASTLQALVSVSWGYPSLLRGCCEAVAAGCPLDESALRSHPAVLRRVEEFWADRPSVEDLRASGLEGHPLLQSHLMKGNQGEPELTALESRLLAALQARNGELCEKDDLVRAVWPEDRVIDGLRDDALAQLVRRLRQKIEPDPSQPRRLITIPGRGYRLLK